MTSRRDFLKTSLCAGISYTVLGRTTSARASGDTATSMPEYKLTRDVPTSLYDGTNFYVHARAGIVPEAGDGDHPRVVMTMNTMNISGNDVFKAMHGMRTDDLGKSWTEPRKLESMVPRYETINEEKRPVACSDFWPAWHASSNTLLGTGHSVVYTPEWKVRRPRPRHTLYSAYDPEADAWEPWKKMEMPNDLKIRDSGAGCTQRVDLEDGTILLPIYFYVPDKNSQVAVAHCSYDGTTLKYLEHGSEHRVDDDTRGLHEPSLARFDGEYFLTIRNDKRGFVTRSKNGLDFEPIDVWKFDDGSDLGNYNTQQHWVTHSDGLFLVYTRRGADNDHVFRHRAPLFMAQVDPRRLRVIRETERILVPERGARLGNFGVTNVISDETWVTVSEWMQPEGVDKYGSDGSVFVARIHWAEPNKLV